MIRAGDKPLTSETETLLHELSAVRLKKLAEEKTIIEINDAAIEASPNGVIVIDLDGHIIRVNRSIETMFGYSRNELVGKLLEILVPDAAKERHVIHRARYANDPRLRPMGIGLDAKGRRNGGTEFGINVMLSPLTISSGTYYMAIVNALLPPMTLPQPIINETEPTVLVIEDDISFAAMFSKVLVTEGYKYDIAATAEIALTMLPTKFYILAVVDLRLPGMSGMDFVRLAKSSGFDTPMIALSGDVINEAELIAAGFVAAAGKPLRVTEILGIIKKFSRIIPVSLEKKEPSA